MNIEDFDKTRFGNGDTAIYKGKQYLIAQVDFEERLFGLVEGKKDEAMWVRCENIQFING